MADQLATHSTELNGDDRPFADPSCYHAAGALLLRNAGHAADPALVLGNSAATGVRLDEEGRLVCENAVRPLVGTLGKSGYRLGYHAIRTRDDWKAAQRVMQSGRMVGLALDSFQVRHYWPGYRRIHALHVLVLDSLDPAAGTVRVLDAGEKVYLDERLPLSDLEPGLFATNLDRTDMGPGWMEVTPPGSGRPGFVPDAPGLVAELTGTGVGPRSLSGLDLVGILDRRMDELLRLVSRHPTPEQAEQAEGLNGQWLLMALWWYHHTLRWLGMHVEAAMEYGHFAHRPEAVEQVAQCSTGFLVVRNLMMRLSVLDPGNPRAASTRERLRGRLAETAASLEKAAMELSRLV